MKRFNGHIILVFFLAAALMVVAAGGAAADSSGFKNYARFDVGMNQPTGDLDDEGYDAGLNLAGAYGRYLNDHLMVEGGVGSFYTDQDLNGSTARTGSYTREDQIGVLAFTGTMKGELPLGPVRLFAGAGVGLYLVALESEIKTDDLGDFDASDGDTAFGAHLVAGGYVDVTPRVFVGIEWLYRWTTDFDVSDSVVTIPVELEGDLNGYAISVTGGFRF